MTPREAEQDIAATAEAMLGGEMDLVEGCRKVVATRTKLSTQQGSDRDLLVLVAIESELDDIPIKAERGQWSKQALQAADAEADQYLQQALPALLQACRALVAKWR